MNTNTMELSMNELELAAGGSGKDRDPIWIVFDVKEGKDHVFNSFIEALMCADEKGISRELIYMIR